MIILANQWKKIKTRKLFQWESFRVFFSLRSFRTILFTKKKCSMVLIFIIIIIIECPLYLMMMAIPMASYFTYKMVKNVHLFSLCVRLCVCVYVYLLFFYFLLQITMIRIVFHDFGPTLWMNIYDMWEKKIMTTTTTLTKKSQ